MASDFAEHVRDQLRELGPVDARSMFGGHGLYHDGVFFGLVWKDRLYLRTDEAGRARYRAEGMKPFRPAKGRTLGTYWQVPDEALEDPRELARRAREALASRESPPEPRRRRIVKR